MLEALKVTVAVAAVGGFFAFRYYLRKSFSHRN